MKTKKIMRKIGLLGLYLIFGSLLASCSIYKSIRAYGDIRESIRYDGYYLQEYSNERWFFYPDDLGDSVQYIKITNQDRNKLRFHPIASFRLAGLNRKTGEFKFFTSIKLLRGGRASRWGTLNADLAIPGTFVFTGEVNKLNIDELKKQNKITKTKNPKSIDPGAWEEKNK